MIEYALKILISATLLVAISEIAKRSTYLAAALASLPLTSLLAFIWMYVDSGDTERIAQLSISIFWLVLPSLILFVTLPALLQYGVNFWLSLSLACLFTLMAYFLMLKGLAYFDVKT